MLLPVNILITFEPCLEHTEKNQTHCGSGDDSYKPRFTVCEICPILPITLERVSDRSPLLGKYFYLASS